MGQFDKSEVGASETITEPSAVAPDARLEFG